MPCKLRQDINCAIVFQAGRVKNLNYLDSILGKQGMAYYCDQP